MNSHLDEIWCPYKARTNTLVSLAHLERQLYAWAVDAGLLADPALRSRFTQARFGECASYVYPDAPDLLVYAKWGAWLFIADDEFDENRAPESGGIDEGVLQYLSEDGAEAAEPTSAVTRALTELWPELAAEMSPELRARFRRHVDQYCRSYATDVARARTGTAPTLAAYLDLRRHSGAVETCVDLIERQKGADLTTTQDTIATVRALRTATNDVVCWTNDVASVGKEVSHGELNNLVAVLRQETGQSWDGARTLAARMTSARVRDFESLQRQLLTADETREAAVFIEGLRNWISGSLAWHRTSPRYAEQVTDV
jgi:hypothetical protein